MAGARLGRSTKRPPLGFCAKVTLAILLGLAFVVLWSTFSSSSSATVSSQRSSFDEIFDPDAPPAAPGVKKKEVGESKKRNPSSPPGSGSPEREKKEGGIEGKAAAAAKNGTREAEGQPEEEREGGEEKAAVEGLDELVEEEGGDDEDIEDGVDVNPEEEEGDEERSGGNKRKKNKKKKKLGPLFDPGARYKWKLCGGRYGHNFSPCVDMEGGRRHHERSCPRIPLMCLVSLPQEYKAPPPWPERESKVLPLLKLVARFEVLSCEVMLIFASI